MANSSPPSRATSSLPRTTARSRCATPTSSSSPAGWPCRSLIALKPSRSMQSTASGSPAAAARSTVAGEMLGEDGAVGKAGQGVVIGEMGDPRRRFLALADVADREHAPLGAAPVQRPEQHLDVADRCRRRAPAGISSALASAPVGTSAARDSGTGPAAVRGRSPARWHSRRGRRKLRLASTTRSPSTTTSPSIAASAKARDPLRLLGGVARELAVEQTMTKLIDRMIAAIATTATVSVRCRSPRRARQIAGRDRWRPPPWR